MHLEIRECTRALYPHTSLSTCSGEKPVRKMCPLKLQQSPTYLLPRQQVYISQPGHMYKSERLGGGGASAQDNCNPQNGFSYSCAQFPISLLSHLCWHTHSFIKSETRQTARPGNESGKKTNKQGGVGLECEGWVTRDREATSYPDQLIYKSNQWESMTGTSIQSGSSVIQANLKC